MRFFQTWIFCFVGLFTLSFSKQFDNGNVVVEKPGSVEIGSSTTFTCTLSRLEQEVTECFIETPRNEVWMVIDGQVLDDQSNVVQGVNGQDNGDPLRTCGISIDVVQSADLGQWKCSIQRSGSKIKTLKAVVELKEEGTKLTGYRLPTHLTPELYKLDLIPIMEPEFLTRGYFEMDGRVIIDQLDGHIFLNVFNTEMLEESLIITLGAQTSITMEILEIHYDLQRDLIIIKYAPYPADASYPIRVAGNFVSQLPYPSGSGFYTDSYKDSESGERIFVAATQFQAVHARKAFPNIDDPGRKAKFQVRLATASGKNAASNMPVLRTDEPVQGYPDYTWYEFPESPIMSSYTLAFFISDFVVATVPPSKRAEFDVLESGRPHDSLQRRTRKELGMNGAHEEREPSRNLSHDQSYCFF
ncbi:aminopeptidase N-like isoform X2 [Tigriopus californicus]|uniref:aminopeptidase N-like isoform X2 n=1 Tax=Tigriopus californicus TaxID=6832 RepID=UPI0027DA19D3|nr:aminopeptidase N-like isoform X2 [Tigriopus californicus]